MIPKAALIFYILLFILSGIQAQEKSYARWIIDTLSAPGMHGRGYVNNGDKTAADFIKNEFIRQGLQPIDTSWFQKFIFPVNTFPKTAEISAEGKSLVPGKDFIVAPFSGSAKGKFQLITIDKNTFEDPKKLESLYRQSFKNKFLIFDSKGITEKKQLEFLSALKIHPLGAKGMVVVKDEKFTWSVADTSLAHLVIEVQRAALPEKPKSINVHIQNDFFSEYASQNVIAYSKGTLHPDSFIVFTAHYDHLGRMGSDIYFPGANDNASGIALLLDLAGHYVRNPGPYSIAFIAFSAEEIGLIGSKFYCENPLFPLSNIRFLINLDLLGNGQDGITVVNGSVFQEEFELLQKINYKNNYVVKINERGKAANSDHYWFSEKGVPAFFIYTLGGSKAYHDIFDTSEKIELPFYDEIFRLLTNFTASLTGGYEGK
jgi:aminopeptidase YwaD